MTELSLPDKVVALAGALTVVPHAFGGALALAYYAEPRATQDIDLNVFVADSNAAEVLSLLAPLGVEVEGAERVARSDGQVRVHWGRTPVDLFFAYDRFHEAARRSARVVPFAGSRISVLAPEHLFVCKVVFDRPKDWVDLDAVLAQGTSVDAAEVLRWVGRLVGDEDRRYDRVAALLTNGR